MRGVLFSALMVMSLFSVADDLRYRGSGRIDALDFMKMIITINHKKYPMNPYSFKVKVDGDDLPRDLLKVGYMVKFYETESGLVGRVEVTGSRQLKERLKRR